MYFSESTLNITLYVFISYISNPFFFLHKMYFSFSSISRLTISESHRNDTTVRPLLTFQTLHILLEATAINLELRLNIRSAESEITILLPAKENLDVSKQCSRVIASYMDTEFPFTLPKYFPSIENEILQDFISPSTDSDPERISTLLTLAGKQSV